MLWLCTNVPWDGASENSSSIRRCCVDKKTKLTTCLLSDGFEMMIYPNEDLCSRSIGIMFWGLVLAVEGIRFSSIPLLLGRRGVVDSCTFLLQSLERKFEGTVVGLLNTIYDPTPFNGSTPLSPRFLNDYYWPHGVSPFKPIIITVMRGWSQWPAGLGPVLFLGWPGLLCSSGACWILSRWLNGGGVGVELLWRWGP